MLILNQKGVEIFINKFQTNKTHAFWNNYDLYLWKKTENGFTDIYGLYKNNSWGIYELIPLSENGVWRLPKKYVKYFI